MQVFTKCLTIVATIVLVAVDAIGQESQPEITALIAELENRDASTRGAAAVKLARLGSRAESATNKLIQLLADDAATQEVPVGIPAPTPTVADDAQAALIAIGAPAAIPLVAAAAKSARAKARQRALYALESIGPPARPALAKLQQLIGRADLDEATLFASIRAYSSVNGTEPDGLTRIARFLSHKSAEIRGLAARSLGRQSTASAPHVGQLTQLLTDRASRTRAISPDAYFQRSVRFDAAEALGRIGPKAQAAAPQLRRMMQSDSDAEVRAVAATSVYLIAKDQRAIERLIVLLDDDKQGNLGPQQAAIGLSTIGSPAAKALKPLTRRAARGDAPTRMAAMDAIGALEHNDSPRTLLELSQQADDSYLAAHAIKVLGQLGEKAKPVLPRLKQLAKAKSADERLLLALESAILKIESSKP